MKKLALLAATTALLLPGCITITGSIDIPGPNGKAPIGTIGFSQKWPFEKVPTYHIEPPLPAEPKGKAPVTADPHWTPGAP